MYRLYRRYDTQLRRVHKNLGSYISNTKRSKRLAFCSTALFIGITALTLFPLSHQTDNTEAAGTLSTTTLTLSTESVSLSSGINGSEGSFITSDPANVLVNTNNYTGYTLSLSASTNINNITGITNTATNNNYTKLINTEDTNQYLNSISSASTPEEFNVGNWGYLINKTTGTITDSTIDTTKYQPAPNLDGTTLDTTNRANTGDNTYTITLGLKADYSTPTGTYTNSYVVNAVANPVNYIITYNQNTDGTVDNMPDDQAGGTSATSITIPSNVPVKGDNEFLGWCDTTTTAVNYVDQCSGTTYQPGDTIDIDQTAMNSTNLYAMWKVPANFNLFFSQAGKEKVTINGKQYYKMQDMTAEICSATETGSVAQLVDIRDNTIYHVGKLADNRCWFLDNLALDLTDNNVKASLNSSNTNASNKTIGYLKNGGGTTNDKYATVGVANWNSDNSYSAPLINMASKDVVPNNASVNSKGNNKVGGYYNYCAVSAGSYCYGNGTSEGTSVGNATEDICPAGWRIPTSNTTGEYQILYTAYNSVVANFRSALAIPLSGYFRGNSARNQGYYGGFWSNTRISNYSAYVLYADASSINPSDRTDRDYGYSIRCIANTKTVIIVFDANGGEGTMPNQIIGDYGGVLENNTFTREGYKFTGWNTKADGTGTPYADGASYDGVSTTLYAQWKELPAPGTFARAFSDADKTTITINNVEYYKMQDMTTDICSAVSQNQEAQLVDIRDNKIYRVSKIADNRCWMTQNLNIAGGTELTPEKSNVFSNYTLPTSSTAGFDDDSKAFVYNDNTYGGYYSFVAVTAGANPASGTATADICPRGWRLPIDTEYNKLQGSIQASIGSHVIAAPWYGKYGGYGYGGSIRDIGKQGDYWTSVARDLDDRGAYYTIESNLIRIWWSPKRYGFSVRCIAK